MAWRIWLTILPILLLVFTACPKRSTFELPQYQIEVGQAYLSGEVDELLRHHVLNRRDFVYTIGYDPTAQWVAYPHMVMTDFELSLAEVATGEVLWQVPLNPTEFDVEALTFTRGGVVVASRRSAASTHPNIRLHAIDSGATRGVNYVTDERGITQIAPVPGLGLIAAVTYKEGNLVLFRDDTLVWAGEARAHRGPATAVAVGSDGLIYTGGQDHSIAVWRLEPVQPRSQGQALLPLVLLGEARQQALLVSLAGRRPVALAIRTDAETTTVTSALVQSLGLQPSEARRTIRTGAGELSAPTLTLPQLLFKDLVVADVPAVVCDECVPIGCDAAIGLDLSSRVQIRSSPVTSNVLVEVGGAPGDQRPDDATTPAPTPEQPVPGGSEGAAGDLPTAAEGGPMPLYQATLVQRFKMDGAVNDLGLSRDGARLCAAISSEPAERSLELYEREKRGEYPPASPQNAALVIDPRSGEVQRRFEGHRGFVVTAALSPDGATLASGAWDNHVMVFDIASGRQVDDLDLAWLVRRVRFAPDGRTLAVAAWTPPNAASKDSEPAAIIYDLVYRNPIKVPLQPEPGP